MVYSGFVSPDFTKMCENEDQLNLLCFLSIIYQHLTINKGVELCKVFENGKTIDAYKKKIKLQEILLSYKTASDFIKDIVYPIDSPDNRSIIDDFMESIGSDNKRNDSESR